MQLKEREGGGREREGGVEIEHFGCVCSPTVTYTSVFFPPYKYTCAVTFELLPTLAAATTDRWGG